MRSAAPPTKPPRLVDFSWGPEDAPKVTLVGKGVCFDTGGLDIKPSSGMYLMKKDMGGAATALALAHDDHGRAVCQCACVCCCRLSRMRSRQTRCGPSDVYPSRKGLSVEIGNTDAEGRLILADALALADEDAPGAAFRLRHFDRRGARGARPRSAALLYRKRDLAAAIAQHGATANDPVWRLPLWQPYDKLIDSKIADITNNAASGFAGSITAALFLKRFVEKAQSLDAFRHLRLDTERQTRPAGGRRGAGRPAHLRFARKPLRDARVMTNNASRDPRLTPARPDLAAAHLRGAVEAARYVEGRPMHLRAGIADLRRTPSLEAPIDTQVLFGETVTLYDEDEGWAWVQLASDGYVGYVSRDALAEGPAAPTHRVKVNHTFIYPAANMKLPIAAP